MKMKIKDTFAAMLGFLGFMLGFGVVGRMESDVFFPISKAVALMFASFMFIGMGIALARWDRCNK